MSASSVIGLSPGTTYHFALDTVTEPHSNNQNTVVSERTAEVMATTAAGPGSAFLGWGGVSLGADGALVAYVGQPSGATHVVIDVNGYFE